MSLMHLCYVTLSVNYTVLRENAMLIHNALIHYYSLSHNALLHYYSMRHNALSHYYSLSHNALIHCYRMSHNALIHYHSILCALYILIINIQSPGAMPKFFSIHAYLCNCGWVRECVCLFVDPN